MAIDRYEGARRRRKPVMGLWAAVGAVGLMLFMPGPPYVPGGSASPLLAEPATGVADGEARPGTPMNGGYMYLQPSHTQGNCPAPLPGGRTTVGCRFVLDLVVNTGMYQVPNGITAQQSYLTFTHELIKNARVDQIAATCTITHTATLDGTTFDAVLQNEVCNGQPGGTGNGPCTFRGLTVPAGSFAFASGAFGCPDGCDGIFRLAQVALCAVAPGEARLHWQFSPPAPPTRGTLIVRLDGELIQRPSLFYNYVFTIAAPGASAKPLPMKPAVGVAGGEAGPITPMNGAYLYLQPSHTQGNCPAPLPGGRTTVGCRFVLDLMVNTGMYRIPNGITAQQSYLTFTHELIKNARLDQIATTCTITHTATLDTTMFDVLLQNEICNGQPGGAGNGPCTFRGLTVPSGSFAFASAELSCVEGCQGVFRVAQVALCAVAPGEARLHWQFSPPEPPTRDTLIVRLDGEYIKRPSLYYSYVFTVAAPGGYFTEYTR